MRANDRRYDFNGRLRFCEAVARRSKLRFRPATAGDEAEIQLLCRKVFGIALNEDEWQWRNVRNPCGPTLTQVAEKEGRIVGHLSGVPTDLKIGDSRRKAFLIVDSVVDPAWRGRGIHAALTIEMSNRFCEQADGLGFGLPNNQAYAPMLKLGIPRVLTMPVFMKVLDWRNVLRSKIRSPFAASALGNIANTFRRRRRPLELGGIELEEIYHFGTPADQLWQRIASHFNISAIRNAAFLNWRYFQRPSLPYRVFSASCHGQWIGYVVVRMLHKWDIRLGTLVDLVFDPAEPDAGALLAERAQSVLKEDGADAIWGLFAAPRIYEQTLRGRGFFKTVQKGHPRPFHVVIDLVSLEHRRPDLAARDHPMLRQGDNWFLSLGDTDLA